MQKRVVLVGLLLLFLGMGHGTVQAQKRTKGKVEVVSEKKEVATGPKLVVGIVVDQMRYDYLTRFRDQYGEGGFKRLMDEGFNCKNNHYNYAPTYTGPGHASVYTGTTPAIHGIIGNDWYDKVADKEVYCAADDAYQSVGTQAAAGKMSPHRMASTTVTDELRLHTQMRGKVIAVSLKDRGAVLPGGHTANAAYWFHGSGEGNWISSSYYMSELPQWVRDFNAARHVDQYKKAWTTLRDIATYVESGPDNTPYEGTLKGHGAPIFPYDLPALWDTNGQYEILKSTPFGNSLTTDFALLALEKETLGADADTDFLAVSYSATDYVGHHWGVNSKEVQDTYMRLDQDIERLLNRLDQQVGAGEYTVFLTADHAAVHVPAYLKDHKIPGGYLDMAEMRNKLDDYMRFTYGTKDIIKNISNDQIFLDHRIIKNLAIDVAAMQQDIAQELLRYNPVYKVYTANQMWQNEYTQGIAGIMQQGYNQKRSGDVLLVYTPAVIEYSNFGSTHGSPWIYDTHAPLLFFGKGINTGSTIARTEIPDIAPTISALLGMAFPSGTTGAPIVEVLQE